MDKIIIEGGTPLRGTVEVSGAKNAAIPVLIASLLTDKKCSFRNVPDLHDIKSVLLLLQNFGARIEDRIADGNVSLQMGDVASKEAPYDLVRKMRGSFVVLGPMLARYGWAKVSLPGGCSIGARPVNYHLTGLEKLGAKIQLEQGYVIASAKKLLGDRVAFEFPSVGATENLMMAAAIAKGETLLENCAKEPEIVDLANALRAMGAEIEGDGTENINIQGKHNLSGCQYSILGDRIEAGTFLAACFATNGSIKVKGIHPKNLEAVLDKLEEAGARITRGEDGIELLSEGKPKATNITTLPFPGFPTDMQAQFMAAMTMAKGTSTIKETIFENRFMHIPELCRMGADISIHGQSAIVKGVKLLRGAPLMATDLRASASLIIGGLCAEGETVVNRIYHLDRGYSHLCKKLKKLGANIRRAK